MEDLWGGTRMGEHWQQNQVFETEGFLGSAATSCIQVASNHVSGLLLVSEPFGLVEVCVDMDMLAVLLQLGGGGSGGSGGCGSRKSNCTSLTMLYKTNHDNKSSF